MGGDVFELRSYKYLDRHNKMDDDDFNSMYTSKVPHLHNNSLWQLQ